jgi:hypothetical protein
MKALSVQQPWAWLVINGIKDIENRKWSTKFRGEFLIHTGRTFDMKGYCWIEENMPEVFAMLPELGAFRMGGIVGKATLVDCIMQSESKWFFGPYGFVLTRATSLPWRPYRGKLGFFEVASHANS